ncbi:substrate-binding domain-containing protein [Caulobacter sp. FWC2]|uniref:substrate-binding domain-containing protein n=1 Tax=Caulobacter sp. FWC2 TaxID=69664 RepID=UPI000C14F218|nr:substrate-binding domain-containing protein [Caulobacter sp. FWC2]PIB92768.1 phosphate ABC transporter substrate-binding protein [Caulobacter sp. FWC2]
MNKLLAFAVASALAMTASVAHAARDTVWAVGSSTVYPLSIRVAEAFHKKTGRKPPRIESLGTGGGFKRFCAGAGDKFPDIANASRPMTKAEFAACQAAGVKDIVELKIGLDGIVVATDDKSPDYAFKLEHLYLGLSANVLRNGEVVKNPYKQWNEVGAELPAGRIIVYGPPASSGTRDAWLDLAIEPGARKFPTNEALRAQDPAAFKARVDPMRSDGGWVDGGENDEDIVGTIQKTPGTLGVFGYSFLVEHSRQLKAAAINGVKPTPRSIIDGSYPLSRPLYIYVKKANVGITAGLREFVAEFVSDAAIGRGGYLQSRGLVPEPQAQQQATKTTAVKLTPMAAPAR